MNPLKLRTTGLPPPVADLKTAPIAPQNTAQPLDPKTAALHTGQAYGESSHRAQGVGQRDWVQVQTGTPPSVASVRLGPPPPAASVVRQQLPDLLTDRTLETSPGQARLGDFQSGTEAYFAVYYQPKSGKLTVRKVASDAAADQVKLGFSAIEGRRKSDEVIIGGFHNHPAETVQTPSQQDQLATAALQKAIPGYRDFVLAVDTLKNAKLIEIQPNTLGAIGLSPERLTYASIFKMNREIDQGKKGTEGLERADRAHIPGDEDHVHTDEGPAIKKGGGWKDRGGKTDEELDELLTEKNKGWLKGWGWNVQ